MLCKERAYAAIDLVLEETRGFDTRVVVQGGTEALTRVANSEIHQNVQSTGLGVTVVITRGGKRSAITTELLTKEELRRAAREAIDNLEHLPEGEEQPPLVETPSGIEALDLDDELERQYSVENRARLVAQNLTTLKQGYRAFGALAYKVNLLALGNSRGIRRLVMNNSVEFKALVASEEGGTGYAEARSGRAGALDIPSAFARAYSRARLNRDPADLEPRPYTVILEPLAVGDILTFLAYMGFSGKSVQDRSSFLTGRMGQNVFDEKVTIVDDYTDCSVNPLPFDFEGTPRQKVAIIEKGVAKGLTHDLTSALKEGVESTGHALLASGVAALPLNLVMAGGEQSLEEIIAGTVDGLLVTRFNYMNPVNSRSAQLTALTRDGLFRVKEGKIAGAVKNMRFTESMLNAFNSVEAVSKERERTGLFGMGTSHVPALKVTGFPFTGKSA
ncbi:MAG: TldD/PmbA family protein [Firmicutes bacterium]|nr:TldD/PmbA family protein [Bacillota bacterium]